jgi:hypothetical protein
MADDIVLPGTGVTVDTRDQGSGVQRQVVEVHDDLFHSSTTITPNSAAYSAGYNMGGKLTFSSFSRGKNGVIKRVLLRSNFVMAVPAYMHIFAANPSGTFTDHAAMPTLDATAIANLIKTIPFYSWDLRSGQAIYQAEFEGVDIPYILSTAATAYAALEVGAAVTPGSTKTLWVDLWTKDN